MWIDAGVALIILIAVALGWAQGFLAHFLGIAGLVVAWLATPHLSPWIAKAFAGQGYTAGSVGVASALLSFAAVLLLFRIAQGYLPEALEKWSHGAKRLDSGLGAVLGGVRGLLLCWLILSAGVLVQGTLFKRFPDVRSQWRVSQVVDATRRYNPVAEVSFAPLAALQRALAEPSRPKSGVARDEAVDDDALEPLSGPGPARGARRARRRPTTRPTTRPSTRPTAGPLDDPVLRAAARRKDWGALLADRRVEALLADDAALQRAIAALK